ncbi:hypothetical protein [Halomarina litorea]|uniref:hypothetical protein n=1 Tax=Halomarina litorea TaxID=2961595 RepID=UPI0020C39E6D|nr:hypothetical protein [Halomarina sp. BCD28]
MSDEGTDDAGGALDSVESGLDALTLVEVAADILEAIDVEALQGDAPITEAIDEERLRAALGGPAGRIVARELADRVTGGGVTGLVGRELAGRVGANLVEAVVDNVDSASVAETLEEMDAESFADAGTDTGGDDGTVIDIDDEE